VIAHEDDDTDGTVEGPAAEDEFDDDGYPINGTTSLTTILVGPGQDLLEYAQQERERLASDEAS
jgi:hypothetical protein